MDIRNQILSLAAKEVGYKEGLNNDNKFGQWFGFNNVAWCAEAVSKIYFDAGFPLQHGGWPKGYASVPELFKQAVNRGWITKNPKPGDIVIYDWTGDGSADHVGIVKEVIPGFVIAYEGNTGDKNWSNGDGFYERKRAMATVKAFVNVLDVIPQQAPTVFAEGSPEDIFNKIAQKNLSNFKVDEFKSQYKTLYKSIIESIDLALKS